METEEPIPSSPPAPPQTPVPTPTTSPSPTELPRPAPAPDPVTRHQDDHLPLDTPELRRGLSAQLVRMEDTLRDTTQLVEAQRKDHHLQHLRGELEAGRGENREYVLADDNLLWHAPRGRAYAMAVPKQLVPAVLALVHGTYGHPGAARTTILIERRYHWPTLKKDVRAYVLSCKCRRRKTGVEQAATHDACPTPSAMGGPRDGHPRHEGLPRQGQQVPTCGWSTGHLSSSLPSHYRQRKPYHGCPWLPMGW